MPFATVSFALISIARNAPQFVISPSDIPYTRSPALLHAAVVPSPGPCCHPEVLEVPLEVKNHPALSFSLPCSLLRAILHRS
jgi:hypothetical protein